MQFNNHSDEQDLINDITFHLGGVTIIDFTIKARTRSINEWLRTVWTWIFESYGGWQFIDDNISGVTGSGDVPYADQTITTDTGLYGLPSAALTVAEVSILLSSGSRQQLKPLTHEEFIQLGGDAHWPSGGVPENYMLQGDIVRLLPVPNYTKANNGIRVYFDEGISIFVSTNTAVFPGFASPFHRILSIGASRDYAAARESLKEKVPNLTSLVLDYEKRIKSFYSKRFKQRFPARIVPGEDLAREFR